MGDNRVPSPVPPSVHGLRYWLFFGRPGVREVANERCEDRVGGVMEEEASRRFVNAWHRAERGETFQERYLAFESWDALARVMSGKLVGVVYDFAPRGETE